uniref:Uncharacterized protein n=1 Tax=Oryza sativa subsp. japonica TaxID=39947 RepID=Q2R3K2_ORYSJ|nr:hypothetical protein LOC_Os11g31650 [Oryza sativa Japonica Group]
MCRSDFVLQESVERSKVISQIELVGRDSIQILSALNRLVISFNSLELDISSMVNVQNHDNRYLLVTFLFVYSVVRMKKGLHPQMQWISYVTQSGRLINIMMTKVNHTGKVYHMRAKRQMAQSLGQIAKFNRRYQQESEENKEK